MIKVTSTRRRRILGLALLALAIGLLALGSAMKTNTAKTSTTETTHSPTPIVEPAARTVTVEENLTLKQHVIEANITEKHIEAKLGAKLWFKHGSTIIDPINPNLAKLLLAALGNTVAREIDSKSPPETIHSAQIDMLTFYLEVHRVIFNTTSNTTFSDTIYIPAGLVNATVTVGNTTLDLDHVLAVIESGNTSQLPQLTMNDTLLANFTAVFSLQSLNATPPNTTLVNATITRLLLGTIPIAVINATIAANETNLAAKTELVFSGPAPITAAVAVNLYAAITRAITMGIIDPMEWFTSEGPGPAPPPADRVRELLTNCSTNIDYDYPDLDEILYDLVVVVHTPGPPYEYTYPAPIHNSLAVEGTKLRLCGYCVVTSIWRHFSYYFVEVDCIAPDIVYYYPGKPEIQFELHYNSTTITAMSVTLQYDEFILLRNTTVNLCPAKLYTFYTYGEARGRDIDIDIDEYYTIVYPGWGCINFECPTYPCTLRLALSISVSS